MTFSWKENHIDLSEFYQFLKNNIPNSDGIVADEIKFIIVETQPFTQEEINSIDEYYNSL
jgi:hypothetical protein